MSTLDTALKDREDLSMESVQVRAKTNKLPRQILPPRVHAIDSYVTKYGSLVTWCVPCDGAPRTALRFSPQGFTLWGSGSSRPSASS